MSLAPDALRESATGRHRRPVSLDVALKQSVKQSLRTPYREARELRDPVLWAITGAVLLASCVLSLSRYIRVSPATWDLGIFTEAIHRYAHLQSPTVDIKSPGFDLLGDHFHPILVVLAPFFRVFPTPVTLLVAQALLTALSVIPVYLAAQQLLGQTEARLIAAAYGFSWGLAAMNAYDFHEVCFAVPLLAASLSCLIRGNVRATVLWAMPLVFVKEDQGLTLAALGVVMVLFYRLRREGLFVTYWGVAWSTVAVYVVIPALDPSHVYPYWDHGGHISGLLTSGLWTKLPTLAFVLLPTVFAALWSPIALVAVPGLLLRFVSGESLFWGTAGHYNATLMPIVFIAAIDGIARARASSETARSRPVAALIGRHGAAMALACSAAIAFQSPLSQLWNPSTYHVDARAHAADAAMKVVPSGTTVEASLNELAPLAARDDVYWWSNVAPQWILFDSSSPEWQVSPAFIAGRHAGVSYRTVFNRDGIWVYERT
jgi:uncharacterized membrane protein